MRRTVGTCILLVALAACTATVPMDVPDAAVPGVPRIDVSEWRGVVNDKTVALLEQLGRA
jgi:predicted small lipoprotein YifL